MAGSAVGEFARHYKHVDQRAVAPHRHLDAAGDRVLDHQLLDRGRGDDVVAVDADYDVAAAKTRLGGRAALDDTSDLQSGGGAQPRAESRSADMPSASSGFSRLSRCTAERPGT